MSIFSHVKGRKPRYNTFDLSHDRKMSLNMGELVPIFLAETVPGDVFRMSTSQLLRFAPMIAPVMHRVSVYTHFFFVPNRIVWPNWEKFITGGEDGTDTTVFPFHVLSQVNKSTIGDYMGFPTDVGSLGNVSSLPIAGYNKIYNEYYRDQNLIDPIPDEVVDGSNNTNFSGYGYNSDLHKRAWQHDYFTSALPWTQRGPAATIPLTGEADINWDPTGQTYFRNPNTGAIIEPSPQRQLAALNRNFKDHSSTDTYDYDNTGKMSVDLETVNATTINDLRRAFRLQEWLEKQARGGARYTETILSHFGVHTGDARLNRPEFLGGGMTPVNISEVLQTSDASAGDTPQGNMAGHGISVGKSHSFKYFCREHGYIFGIMSVMPKTAYQDGIPKHFRKFDKFDHYWPSFANIGEQPIYNWELFVDGKGSSETENDDVFGYIPRYAEYKYMNDTVHGEMRDTLDFWHMGRKFANTPKLNKEFVEANPTDRIFAVMDSEKLYAHVYNKVSAKRPMPYYGTPTI